MLPWNDNNWHQRSAAEKSIEPEQSKKDEHILLTTKMTAIKIKQRESGWKRELIIVKVKREKVVLISNYLIFAESTGIADSFKKLSAGCIFHHNSQMCGGQNHLQIVTIKQQNSKLHLKIQNPF